jgi:hypothetical protein
MIILGDEIVPYENISFISTIDEIGNTKANSTLLFCYDVELVKYTFENNLPSAVIVKSLKDAIYCNSLNVKYIVSEKNLAIQIQKIADSYMYDSKNIAIINSNEEFEHIAKDEIDGVIYRNLIK